MGQMCQHHDCWYTSSLCHQVISNHDIDCIAWMGPCLPWERPSITCAISVWRYDIKSKNIFSMINSAWQGVIKNIFWYQHLQWVFFTQHAYNSGVILNFGESNSHNNTQMTFNSNPHIWEQITCIYFDIQFDFLLHVSRCLIFLNMW